MPESPRKRLPCRIKSQQSGTHTNDPNWRGFVETNRETIAKLEVDIAKESALAAKAERLVTDAQGLYLMALRGERFQGDDETMLGYANAVANRRDAEIRAAPRPAARGKRGRQKRPHWLRRKEDVR
jgi:hypothetical protein